MNAEEINKKIQIEKDSYARDLNRLQNEIFKLKQRHQRNLQYWNRLKEKKYLHNQYSHKILLES